MGSLRLEASGVSVDCGESGLAVVAQLDGGLILGRVADDPTTSATPFTALWTRNHKTPLRRARFGNNDDIFAITKGKSLIQYDLETGKKKCVKVKAHTAPPFALCPFAKGDFHVVATGDDEGVVKLWDFRAEDPLMAEFTDHSDYVTDIGVTADGRQVVSTSADTTLCAYTVGGKKLIVQSEELSSELLSVAHVSTQEGQTYFACGSGDGHVELFREGEYGNILERLESRHKGSVDCVRAAGEENPNFLVSGSNDDGSIRLLHLHPHRVLATLGHHEDGTEEIAVDAAGHFLLSVGHDSCLRFWDLQAAIAQIPLDTLRRSSAKKTLKKMKVRTAVSDPTFFDGLADSKSSIGVPTAIADSDDDSD